MLNRWKMMWITATWGVMRWWVRQAGRSMNFTVVPCRQLQVGAGKFLPVKSKMVFTVNDTRNTFCVTRYLSHYPTTSDAFNPKILQLFLVPNKTPVLKLSPSVTSDIIGHVTIGLLICGFQLVVSFNQPSISHGFWDIKLQRYWGHDFDLLGPRMSSVTWPLDDAGKFHCH